MKFSVQKVAYIKPLSECILAISRHFVSLPVSLIDVPVPIIKLPMSPFVSILKLSLIFGLSFHKCALSMELVVNKPSSILCTIAQRQLSFFTALHPVYERPVVFISIGCRVDPCTLKLILDELSIIHIPIAELENPFAVLHAVFDSSLIYVPIYFNKLRLSQLSIPKGASIYVPVLNELTVAVVLIVEHVSYIAIPLSVVHRSVEGVSLEKVSLEAVPIGEDKSTLAMRLGVNALPRIDRTVLVRNRKSLPTHKL